MNLRGLEDAAQLFGHALRVVDVLRHARPQSPDVLHARRDHLAVSLRRRGSIRRPLGAQRAQHTSAGPAHSRGASTQLRGQHTARGQYTAEVRLDPFASG
jgi:hypothetical protein